VKQAAQYLGVSTTLLNRYKTYAVLPYVQIGSRVKFKRDDLDDFIDEHRVVDMDDGWPTFPPSLGRC
jgi:excisionase family DNA binding protein